MTAIQRLSRRVRRALRYYYLRLVRIDDSPEKIAGGVALGIFLGVFPTFGLGLILAVALASWLHVNRAAALLGALIMNPFTTPFFWTLSATVGAIVFQAENSKILEAARHFEQSWAAVFRRGALVYLVGNTIVSIVFAAVGYAIARRFAAVVHAKRRERRHRRAARRAAVAAVRSAGASLSRPRPGRPDSVDARPPA